MNFYNFLEMQYKLGHVGKENLKSYIPKFISQEEYEKIIQNEIKH